MFDFLVGDFGIAFGLVVLCYGLYRIFPHTARAIWSDPPRWRQLLNRGLFATGALAVAWITVVDNWRKFLGAPSGWFQNEKAAMASDPFYSASVPDEVRFVSWLLFLAAVVAGAYFFARYSRGWVEPILLGPLALILFYIFNSFRLRFDVDSVRIAYATIESPFEILSTLTWILGLWISMGFLIIAIYIVFWAPAALVGSILYRLILSREPYEEPLIYEFMRHRRGNEPGDEGSVTR